MHTTAPLPVRQLALGTLALLIAAILIGGEQPGAGALFPHPWDKLVHFIVYGSIAVLSGLAFPRWPLPAIVLFVVGVGACDELHQAFLPGREAGVADLIADGVGALLFLPMVTFLRRWLLPVHAILGRA